MLPDDVFRSRMQTTITALQYWAPSIADAAQVEETETGSFWKITVTPGLPNACPFELIVHFDQRYDLAIGSETYESLPIESFDMFLPFVEAVADGNVVQRRRLSRLTGLERSVETLVTLANGATGREVRGERQMVPAPDGDRLELRAARAAPMRA